MKTSKAYFKRFKKAFIFWQEKFGLTQYDICLYHMKLDDGYAQIKINELNKTADVYLNLEIPDKCVPADSGPEGTAKHEAIHLLLNRIDWLGKSRIITETDIDEENEAIVNRLMGLLKQKD